MQTIQMHIRIRVGSLSSHAAGMPAQGTSPAGENGIKTPVGEQASKFPEGRRHYRELVPGSRCDRRGANGYARLDRTFGKSHHFPVPFTARVGRDQPDRQSPKRLT